MNKLIIICTVIIIVLTSSIQPIEKSLQPTQQKKELPSPYSKRTTSRYECFGYQDDDPRGCSRRGRCIDDDTCECNDGFLGRRCEFHLCFNISSNDPNVCSSRGNCIDINNCDCDEGYGGRECETILCFGIERTDQRVCSSRGTCIDIDTCDCTNRYIGDECESYTCNGIVFFDENVCSTRGTCKDLNQCDCKEGYSGKFCGDILCNEIKDTNSTVCNGRGTCISPNFCLCEEGYIGSDCQIPVCFGIPSTSSNVCSNRNGTCVDKNTCVCKEGYTGEECQIPICFGELQSSKGVCSFRNGTCIAKDTCLCSQGYVGVECEVPICFEKTSTNEQVCSGNGKCIKKDTCFCKEGYTGDQCEIPICYSILATDPSVCSSRNGECIANNSCLCKEGYEGEQCSIPICFGISSTSEAVCSFKNGTCIDRDNCACNKGYIGEQCNIPICFDVNANNSIVCSENGVCIKKDNCQCNDGYIGETCDIPICFGIPSTNQTVCSSQGECVKKDTCECNFCYGGLTCEPIKCPPNFYCNGCNKFCRNIVTCNSNGKCNETGDCECFRQDNIGYFKNENCNECAEGFVSKNCQSKVFSSFSFSERLDRLVGSLLVDGASQISTSEIDCRKLLNEDSIRLVGMTAQCWWSKRSEINLQTDSTTEIQEKFRYFEIVFGKDPLIVQSSKIVLNLNAMYEDIEPISRTLEITIPLIPISPTAVIQSSMKIGACDDLILDGSFSFSIERRPLIYKWEFLKAGNLNLINEGLKSKFTSIVSVENSFFLPSEELIVKLTIVNFLGFESSTITTISKIDSTIAIPSIIGSSIQTITAGFDYIFEGEARFSRECISNNSKVSLRWKQTSGGIVLPIQEESQFLVIASNYFVDLVSPDTFIFELSVLIDDNIESTTTTTLTLNVQLQRLVSIIKGAAEKVIARGSPFLVDGTSSFDLLPEGTSDEEEFFFECFDLERNLRLASLFVYSFPTSRLRKLEFPPNELDIGRYNFSMTYKKGIRLSSTFVIVEVREGIFPIVDIDTILLEKLNGNNRFKIEGTSSVPEQYTNIRYLWECEINGQKVEIPENVLETSITSKTLIIKRDRGLDRREKFFFEGQRYRFIFNIFYERESTITREIFERGSSFAQSRETIVNIIPRAGVLTSVPESGNSTRDEFTLLCSNFIDEDNIDNFPLRYVFYFKVNDNDLITPLSVKSISTVLRTILPPGDPKNDFKLIVGARVFDQFESFVEVQNTITVYAPPIDEAFNEVKNLFATAFKEADEVQRTGQIALTIGSVLNIELQLIQFRLECLNNCSNNGICIESKCQCIEGFGGEDCSISIEEIVERTRFRTDVLTSVQSIFITSNLISYETVQQQTSTISIFIRKPTESDSELEKSGLDFVSKLIDAIGKGSFSTIVFEEELEDSVTSSISTIANTAFRESLIENKISEKKEVSRGVQQTTNNLISTILSQKDIEEQPTSIVQETIQIKAQKLLSSVLNQGQSIQIIRRNFSSVFPTITIPEGLISEILETQNIVENILDYRAVNFERNPYFFDPSSENISTTVVSFKLQDTSENTEIRVFNISQPIRISIPFIELINISKLELNESLAGFRPVCKFWNISSEIWDTKGCKLVNVDATEAVCECYHLTDFASFIEFIIPDANILNIDDFLNITDLNVDNFLPLIIGLVLFGIYLILLLMLALIDYIFRYRNEIDRYDAIKLIKLGRFRTLIEYIKSGHIWISVVFRPRKELGFSRSQRITVVFMIVFGTLCANALFFETEENNEVQVVVAAFISATLVFPVSIFFAILFRNISPNWKVRGKESIHSIFIESFKDKKVQEGSSNKDANTSTNDIKSSKNNEENDTTGRTFKKLSKIKFVLQKNTEKLIKKIQKSGNEERISKKSILNNGDEDSDLSYWSDSSSNEEDERSEKYDFEKEIKNRKHLRDSLRKKGRIQKIVRGFHKKVTCKKTKSEVQSNSTKVVAEIEREEIHREGEVVGGVKEKSESEQEENKKKFDFVHFVSEIPTLISDIMDDLFDRIELILKKVYSPKIFEYTASIGFLLLSISYVLCIAFVLAVLHVFFDHIWEPYGSTAIVCIAMVIPVFLFVFSFFIERRKKWKSPTEQVTWSWVDLILPILAIIVCFLVLNFAILFGTFLEVWESQDRYLHIVMIIFAMVFLIILFTFMIAVIVRKPTKKEIQEQKEVVVYEPFIPRIFLFVLYPICWAYMFVCIFLMVLYGIKFGEEKAARWLKASFLGVGGDAILFRPFAAFGLVLFFTFIINIIQMFFIKTIKTKHSKRRR